MEALIAHLRVVPTSRIAPTTKKLVQLNKKSFSATYKIVTILSPLCHPIFLTSLTQAKRLLALLEPRNRPSLCTRYRDILTASASDILSICQFLIKLCPNLWDRVYRNASLIMGSAISKLCVGRLIPLEKKHVRKGVNPFKQKKRLQTFLPRRYQLDAVVLCLLVLCHRTLHHI